jgi:hypothetical protein
MNYQCVSWIDVVICEIDEESTYCMLLFIVNFFLGPSFYQSQPWGGYVHIPALLRNKMCNPQFKVINCEENVPLSSLIVTKMQFNSMYVIKVVKCTILEYT